MQDFGKILWFDAARVYGFIRPDQSLPGGKNVFVPRSELQIPDPAPGMRVIYDLTEGARGWVARNVRAAGELQDVA